MNSELAAWSGDQIPSAHAFGEETNGHIREVEARYARMLLARRLIAVRYVADVARWTAVGDPHGVVGSLHHGQRCEYRPRFSVPLCQDRESNGQVGEV